MLSPGGAISLARGEASPRQSRLNRMRIPLTPVCFLRSTETRE